MPDNTGKKQGKTQFPKGHSGNPNGRPKGTRNKSTMLERDLEEICDNPCDFDTSTIEADHILILPDNGRRDHGQEIPKGSYSVSFS